LNLFFSDGGLFFTSFRLRDIFLIKDNLFKFKASQLFFNTLFSSLGIGATIAVSLLGFEERVSDAY
jgi:hypothetical protein